MTPRISTHTPRLFTRLIAILFGMTLSGVALAEPDDATALRGIMRQLGLDLQAVTDAIAREDWARVAELAPGIARHPQPPTGEKLRILGWLGRDAGRFRALDGDVHERATALGAAAVQRDGSAVIDEFAGLQKACLACHQEFRAAFVQRFHAGD